MHSTMQFTERCTQSCEKAQGVHESPLEGAIQRGLVEGPPKKSTTNNKPFKYVYKVVSQTSSQRAAFIAESLSPGNACLLVYIQFLSITTTVLCRCSLYCWLTLFPRVLHCFISTSRT